MSNLYEVLDKMIKQERWRKKPKLKGILLKKIKTKTGNIRLTIKKRNKHSVYVLKKNPNLYKKAQKAKKGDLISIAGRMWLGKLFCEKLIICGKANKKYFETRDRQVKLHEV